MHFRPYPVLTLVAIPALALLIALGVWQLQRAEWKIGLIADYERAAAAPPASPDAVLCNSDAVGKVVSAPQTRGATLRVYGHNAAGDVGWRIFQAVKPACSGPTGGVLVETSFEPLQLGGSEAEAPHTSPPAPSGRFIVERWPGKQLMAASNSPESNEWHWFDAPAMAAALGAGALDERYILARLEGMPDYLTQTPPSGHYWYAATWFGMAIAFVVIYALFHARAGRLRFARSEKKQDSGTK